MFGQVVAFLTGPIGRAMWPAIKSIGEGLFRGEDVSEEIRHAEAEAVRLDLGLKLRGDSKKG